MSNNNNAWDLVGIVNQMTYEERWQAFNTCDLTTIIMSPYEKIHKQYEEWSEKKKEANVEAGDEVTVIADHKEVRGIVLYVDERYLVLLLPKSQHNRVNKGIAVFSFNMYGLSVKKTSYHMYTIAEYK